MQQSLARLVELDPDLTVYPGHGPATTIGEERQTNPWLCEL
jgi:glyoxylase-like metal-dependent hydrolase (beta-lactamase superfamily II)